MTLAAGESQSGKTAPGQEAVLYVVAGAADVTVGKLGGRLGPNEFVSVLPGTAYAVSASAGALSFILFEMPGAG